MKFSTLVCDIMALNHSKVRTYTSEVLKNEFEQIFLPYFLELTQLEFEFYA